MDQYEKKEEELIEEEDVAEESAQKTLLRRIWDATGYLIVPVVTVLILFGVVFSLAWVPSGSMESTLPTKSHLSAGVCLIFWEIPFRSVAISSCSAAMSWMSCWSSV